MLAVTVAGGRQCHRAFCRTYLIGDTLIMLSKTSCVVLNLCYESESENASISASEALLYRTHTALDQAEMVISTMIRKPSPSTLSLGSIWPKDTSTLPRVTDDRMAS